MSYSDILFSVENHIARIVINRPDIMNALSSKVLNDFIELSREINTNKDIWAAIITGSGNKSFCAGANLKERNEYGQKDKWEYVRLINRAMGALDQIEVPLIAAINGYAMGGGIEVATACDIRIASDKALLGIPEVALGIMAGGGIVRLSRLINMSSINMLAFTAGRLGANEALNIGLVDKVVPHAELMAKTEELAYSITKNAPLALRASKKLIRLCMESPLEVAHHLSEAIREPLDYTEDCLEGLHSFAEKRTPQFKGR